MTQHVSTPKTCNFLMDSGDALSLEPMGWLERKAIDQFRNELRQYRGCMLDEPKLRMMAEAIFKMRDLPAEYRWTIESICSEFNTGYKLTNIHTVIDPTEFITLPRVLLDLTSNVEWCIEDDGYLDFIRVDVMQHYPNGRGKPFREVPRVFYFLMQIPMDREERARLIRKELIERHTYLLNAEVTSIKLTWFVNCENFTSLLNILNDKHTYDTWASPDSELVDPMFFSDENKLVTIYEKEKK